MINIVLTVLGTVLGGICLFIFITDRGKYDPIISEIDGSQYFIKDIFSVGFRIMYWLGIDVSSDTIQKKTRKLAELFGAKEAKKIAIYDLAAQLSYFAVFLPIAFLLAVVTDETMILLMGVALIVVLAVYIEYDQINKINKRHEIIQREFPHMVSQMALLVNAGMPLREVIIVSAQKGDGILYQELQTLANDMANGIPDYEALAKFSSRCGVDSVRKFSSLVQQNVRKGSSELSESLMELSTEIWRGRVSAVKELGEKASTKLMIPIMIIFIGIMLMVVVPIFSGISM